MLKNGLPNIPNMPDMRVLYSSEYNGLPVPINQQRNQNLDSNEGYIMNRIN